MQIYITMCLTLMNVESSYFTIQVRYDTDTITYKCKTFM